MKAGVDFAGIVEFECETAVPLVDADADPEVPEVTDVAEAEGNNPTPLFWAGGVGVPAAKLTVEFVGAADALGNAEYPQVLCGGGIAVTLGYNTSSMRNALPFGSNKSMS